MVAPAQGVLEIGETVTITMDINTQRLAPALYNGYLNLFSDSATSVMQIPVNLIVPAYQRLVNAGGSAYTDSEGNQWLADHRYVAGSWGYINGGTVLTVTNAIKRTSDDFRFQSQRQNPYAYRFNHLPAGTYEVELDFAELDGKYLGQRIFDVVINDQLVLPAHDIAYAVGLYTAEKQTFFVSVRENGNIDVRLVPRVGFSKPVVNALRIVHRPDR